jgi:hypothetical protein
MTLRLNVIKNHMTLMEVTLAKEYCLFTNVILVETFFLVLEVKLKSDYDWLRSHLPQMQRNRLTTQNLEAFGRRESLSPCRPQIRWHGFT